MFFSLSSCGDEDWQEAEWVGSVVVVVGGVAVRRLGGGGGGGRCAGEGGCRSRKN